MVVDKQEHLDFADIPVIDWVFPQSKEGMGRGCSYMTKEAFPKQVTKGRRERVIFMKMLTAAWWRKVVQSSGSGIRLQGISTIDSQHLSFLNWKWECYED